MPKFKNTTNSDRLILKDRIKTWVKPGEIISIDESDARLSGSGLMYFELTNDDIKPIVEKIKTSPIEIKKTQHKEVEIPKSIKMELDEVVVKTLSVAEPKIDTKTNVQQVSTGTKRQQVKNK